MDQYIEFISNHFLLSAALVFVSFMLFQDLYETTFKKYDTLSPLLAVTKMNSHDAIIVDIREPHEYIKGHIENAINIPAEKFSEQANTLDKYKNQPIIVVCQTGSRSVTACNTLTKTNFEQVLNIKGGMQSWEDSNLPINKSGKNEDV